MRRGIATVVVVLLAAGCSSDPDEKYCHDLSEARTSLTGLADRSDEGAGDYLEPALSLFEDLRADAPSGLRDEWDTIVFAWSDLVDVLERTGVDPTTFDPAKKPEGLSKQDFDLVRAAAAELGTARVQDAVTEVTQHAEEVCGVTLDL